MAGAEQTKNSVDFSVNESEYFRLFDIQKYLDGSAWTAIVKVGAGKFICTGRKFDFDDPHKFLKCLIKCYQDLDGFAELKYRHEEEFLRFLFKRQGQVTITGLLCDDGCNECSFRFRIVADQTFIPQFSASLKVARHGCD